MSDYRKLELCTIGNGAAVEQFDRCLRQVLDNIDDPNTDPSSTRKITLTIEVTPNAQRDMANVSINSVVKVAPMRGAIVGSYLQNDGKKLVALEPNIKQPSLFDDTAIGKAQNVTVIDRQRMAAGDHDND